MLAFVLLDVPELWWQSRRNMLLYAGGALAGAVGLAVLLSTGQQDDMYAGVSSRERATIGESLAHDLMAHEKPTHGWRSHGNTCVSPCLQHMHMSPYSWHVHYGSSCSWHHMCVSPSSRHVQCDTVSTLGYIALVTSLRLWFKVPLNPGLHDSSGLVYMCELRSP